MSEAIPLMPALPDMLLERRAADGDREAWNALITRHDRTVRLSLIARGFSAETAREAAQAAWARLLEQQRAGGLKELKLPGLAIAQAVFLAQDVVRADQRWVGPEGLSDAADERAHGEERAIGREQLARVEALLERQHASAQRVFHLAHGGAAPSHAEIASQTGLSVQRVKQILCELRQRLRPILEEPR